MNLQTTLASLRSPLFMISATALAVLLLITTIHSNQQQQLLNIRTSHYGNSLAEQAASQAANATLTNDRVSLQITLKDIVANPDIFSATIHDVDNRLLVQAGDSPTNGGYSSDNSANYTAPITLHDSIAGYLTVTVDTQSIYQNLDNVWITGLIAVCLLLIGFSFTSHHTHTKVRPRSSDNNRANELAPSHRADSVDVNTCEATLMLHTCNIEALRKKINSSLKQKLYAELAQKLDGINMLYCGKLESASEDWLSIKYSGTDTVDAAFRATCAALLLIKLLQESASALQLEFNGAVFIRDQKPQLSNFLENSKINRRLQNSLTKQPANTILLHDESCTSDSLSQRISTCESNETQWLTVTGLQTGYDSLLEKQALQLQRMLQA